MPPMERNQNEAQVNGDLENSETSRVIDDSPQHNVDRESVIDL